MPRITRRQGLLGGAGVLAVGLAGCIGNGSDTPKDENDSAANGNGDEENTPADEDDSASSGNGDGSGRITESLTVGESFTNPIGNTVTVTEITLQDTVEARRRIGDGSLYQKEPLEGEQWAVVTLDVTNDSGETQYLTPAFQISVRANGTEYTSTAIDNDEDTYGPAEVQSGESRTGWLAYGVPAELTTADIEVVHSNSADGESWTVTWSDA